MDIKPGDIVCLRPSAIRNYTNAYNLWWEGGGFSRATDLKIKVTRVVNGVIYGDQIGGNGRWKNKNFGDHIIYMCVDKQQVLISKIKYLYSKCPTTKHWARES